MSDVNASVLVLGGPKAGKTHYGAQLLGRLRNRESAALVLETPISDLRPFAEALRALEQGLPAGHTSTETYDEISMTLLDPTGSRLDLLWPDYGGEQLKELFHRRGVNERWRDQLHAAQWMLFLRPGPSGPFGQTLEEVTSRLQQRPASFEAAPGADQSWSWWDEGARWVELLQMALYLADRSTARRLTTPKISVLLTCWDELPGDEAKTPPSEVLRGRLPLLAEFLTANWESTAWSIWGLSSLGRALVAERPDPDYAEQGPERFGYVVTPKGEVKMDLTLPLGWLMA